jgi:pentatricopeptide repeat protein
MDIVSWNSMIAGYAQHGYGKEALELSEQMKQLGMEPDGITLVSVLTACNHTGLVDKGRHYFYSMINDSSVMPRGEHYACMVDLLGRFGHLDEAEDFVNKMPVEPNAAVWGALLGACITHGNVQLGERAAEHLFKLQPENPATYVAMSNIYASSGRWGDASRMRKMMRKMGLKKQPGYSWIEVKNKVHTFIKGDRLHPQAEKIYATLEQLAGQMKEAGYVPDTDFALHDIEEDQNDHILCCPS